MKINRLVIENFKSIERIELIEPNPFTVFVGPNGSGKSNIFEALEFFTINTKFRDTDRLFLGEENFLFRNRSEDMVGFYLKTDFGNSESSFAKHYVSKAHLDKINAENEAAGDRREISRRVISFENFPGWNNDDEIVPLKEWKEFYNSFSRVFVRHSGIDKIILNDNLRLLPSANNLEKVLKRILTNPILRDEIFEWLDLFVPGFKAVEVDDRDELHWFESSSSEYFTKDLISDGTYNILALLTAVYQSDDKPQFLCIEEPENGLHPQVLMSLVNFLRQQCEEKGHYIWLNTHSESLVRGLTTDEIILVNKVNGATQTRQIKGRNLYDLPTDEAWLTGALGGGLPW
ncbi:putative ATPase [Spirosoma oryzae]|uniref:Putative ATPase n=1 Tax=Spirosoma oryzae TaxID=1469603 RepID=A0A2T0TNM7_9BACT|nr:ATP-binding protein [Spirosoma oryzae]PRY47253.1 putative ATPase [Spirosoma oryzae]